MQYIAILEWLVSLLFSTLLIDRKRYLKNKIWKKKTLRGNIFYRVDSTKFTSPNIFYQVYSIKDTQPSVFYKVYSMKHIPLSIFYHVYYTTHVNLNKTIW